LIKLGDGRDIPVKTALASILGSMFEVQIIGSGMSLIRIEESLSAEDSRALKNTSGINPNLNRELPWLILPSRILEHDHHSGYRYQ